MRIYKLASKYILKYTKYTVLFGIFTLILWISSLIFPEITGILIDALVISKNINKVEKLIEILLVLGLIEILLTYLQNIISIKLKTKAGFDLNYFVLEHVKRLPLDYFRKVNTTYLNQRINTDSNAIISFVIDNYINILIKCITFIYIEVYIFYIDYRIGIVLSILLPFEVILYFVFKNPLYKLGYTLKEEQNKFFSKMNDQIYNIKIVKINSWFDQLSKELIQKYNDLYVYVVKYSKISYLFSNIDLTIGQISTLILFSYGSLEVINNKVSIGNFLIINSYFSMMLSSISYLVNFGKTYQDILISYNRLKEILKSNVEFNGSFNLKKIKCIELKNINFSYGDKKILNNFNYKFKAGNIYCIIGKNGCGKSTLINIILGLVTNYTGYVYYNSSNIKTLNLYDLRKKLISVTEQEPILLNDTIRNNITYGMNYVNNNDIYSWCTEFQISEFINKLPNQFDTILNEKSNNISGGEKQKISLIRTFIKNPDVIILDEPTSALDLSSINILKSILNKIKANKIIIFVTHDSDILNICDEIIKM